MTTYDLSQKKYINFKNVHKNEIFSFTTTFDHAMMITCSRDGYANLLNPQTWEIVREFHFKNPCRAASISPLYDDPDQQKFHCMLAGGQDAKDVTNTQAKEGGFGIWLMSMIYNERLAEVGGHFGTVHTLSFSQDGSCFASGAEDGYVHFHKLPAEYFSKKFE